MSIYAAIEVIEQELTSGSLENLAFAHKLAAKEGSRVFAIAVGLVAPEKLTGYGVEELVTALKEAKAL